VKVLLALVRPFWTIARQLIRLNDNIEAIMMHFDIRTSAERARISEEGASVLEVLDEEEQALEEFRDEELRARGVIPY